MIVKEVSYEVSDPTVDLQVITLQGAGVDTPHHRGDAQSRGAGHPQSLMTSAGRPCAI